jgi:hypothetical protein
MAKAYSQNLAVGDNLDAGKQSPNKLGLHEVGPDIHQQLVQPFARLNWRAWLFPEEEKKLRMRMQHLVQILRNH